MNSIDLSRAVVVTPADLTGPEQKAVTMLVEEVEKRTRIHLQVVTTWPNDRPAIAVGPAASLEACADPYAQALAGGDVSAPEGYRIRIKNGSVLVAGNDARGVLFGIGRLLRTLRMSPEHLALPAHLNITTAPRYRLRGHQLGYRDKTNSYCGWDLAQWEQYYRDLIVFGANAVELIPPRSDDKDDSVHFPLPPLDMMEGMSRLADEYGIDLWIWYPAMDKDYSDPATVEFALKEWEVVFRRLPRIDAILVPGGDPGHSDPRHLMPMLAKQKKSLKRFHPKAQMWVSPQGFTQDWMDAFVAILKNESPDWLDGVVHAPWVHMTMANFRKLIPARYPIRNYPDITHTLDCQYPVVDWDIAYALTEGREVINPRPYAEAAIFKSAMEPTIGFLAYCEGCHDDVNKAVWSSLGWDPDVDLVEALRDYGRFFIGEHYADDFAQGLFALEHNWEGPLAGNTGVYATLQQFQAMEQAASPRDLKNWRFQQALYRAYYDAYVRSRLLYESGLGEQAMACLRDAPARGSLVAIVEAERVLDRAVIEPIAQGWRTRLFQLAEALYQSVHMQLSVPLYRAQEEVRGASLDGVDYPLNDRPWLKARFEEIRKLPEEAERLQAIKQIVEWTNPGPGGFYDDLGASFNAPHVVKRTSFAEDPGRLFSPLRRFPYRKSKSPIRLSWRGYTGALNEQPMQMHYAGLDPEAQYKVRVVYALESARVMVRLDANDGIEIHPFIGKLPLEPKEFDIPREATLSGELTLTWRREPGRGGVGLGTDVSEIWLIKK